jgi:hypothetical protein
MPAGRTAGALAERPAFDQTPLVERPIPGDLMPLATLADLADDFGDPTRVG